MLGCLLIAGIFRVFAGTQESVLAELVILSAFRRTAENIALVDIQNAACGGRPFCDTGAF
jgi:hypothetical protein